MIAPALNLRITQPPMHHEAVTPHWLTDPALFDAQPLELSQVPAHLMPWVELQDSMTAQLTAEFGQQPQVLVHSSTVSPLLEWETGCLGADAHQGYARHISLNVGTRAVLLARSITTLGSTVEPLLSGLQQTPLARVLFEDPRWQRTGTTMPLLCDSTTVGRACTWQDQHSGDVLVVEEFFLF